MNTYRTDYGNATDNITSTLSTEISGLPAQSLYLEAQKRTTLAVKHVVAALSKIATILTLDCTSSYTAVVLRPSSLFLKPTNPKTLECRSTALSHALLRELCSPFPMIDSIYVIATVTKMYRQLPQLDAFVQGYKVGASTYTIRSHLSKEVLEPTFGSVARLAQRHFECAYSTLRSNLPEGTEISMRCSFRVGGDPATLLFLRPDASAADCTTSDARYAETVSFLCSAMPSIERVTCTFPEI